MPAERGYRRPSLPQVPAAPFPGLLAALRPIRRLAAQVADEATLLHRFTYKNKNQHKGCGWWRKVVEADRVVGRLGPELDGLLAEFGVEASEKNKGKEEVRVTGESLAQGLLRLPRSLLLVDKALSVFLGTAAALEQLVATRAFLPFSVVVVAVVARLHTLSTVLRDELTRTSSTLAHLLHDDVTLAASICEQLTRLPRAQQRLVALSRARGSPVPTPLGVSPEMADDGTPVARIPNPKLDPTSADSGGVGKLGTPKPPAQEQRTGAGPKTSGGADASTVGAARDHAAPGGLAAASLPKKRKRAQETRRGGRVRDGDEIDSIFG